MQYPDLNPVMPEIVLILIASFLLIADLIIKRKEVIALLALIGIGAVAYTVVTPVFGVTFSGMFTSDAYSQFFKVIFLINCAFGIFLSIRYLKFEKSLKGEYYSLLLFATVGMMIMASATDLIVLILGLELMALSVYILTAFLVGDKKSNEAAMKYFLLGAFATAFLLYGTSIIYGITGTTDIAKISMIVADPNMRMSLGLIVSIFFIVAAFGFKIAAAPFHMWAPDVYEGAPTPVSAFMSVGPKAAAFAAMGRVFIEAFGSAQDIWVLILIPVAILTMAAGNILAIAQTNIKRMLAYSSVAHAGYALLGLIAGTQDGIAAMMNYLLVYGFMNTGAFAVIILLKSEGFAADQISDYEGLSRSRPLVAALMLLFMFSLTGIPPTAGFTGKFYIFNSLIAQGHTIVAIVALMFSAISAYFYLRIVMLMYMKEPNREASITQSPVIGLSLAVAAVMVIVLGVMPAHVIDLAKSAASVL
jgi:NADH-quinone oxidoreductase subunit N